jgi:acyl-homoserine lactone acylase PvdQ
MIKKLFGFLLISAVAVVALAILGLFYVYTPVTSGVLYLERADGEAEVLRETETSIPHIYASSEKMAVYTQGFLHAQERLWQMERLKRMTQGRLSEIMGEKTLGVDKFFRTIGLHRSAIESVKNLDEDTISILQAYADGINDYVAHIGFNKPESTGVFLPPEFILLGIKEVEPWAPVDSICILKLLNFHLSWNWGQDLLRDVLEKSGLEDMVEEIFPFTAEYSHNLVTIIDPEDIKGTKFWSDETLVQKYHKLTGKLSQSSRVRKSSRDEDEAHRQATEARLLAEEEAQRIKKAEEKVKIRSE